jgi:ribulose-5-phosphate 4-epimerase/fuculose-1-phosphate aldolase
MECGLLPISQHALRFFERVSYHAYEGPAFDLGEQARLIEHLDANDVMMLTNHGSLTVGRSIPHAFNIAYFLECACRIQIDALAGGGPLIVPERKAGEAVEMSVRPDADNKHGVMDGMREWPALLRQIDRADPSYRN